MTLDLPQEVKDLLVGTILGDARMNFTSFKTASFYFEQGAIHKEYLYFLFGTLAMYALNPQPNLRTYIDKRTGKTGQSLFFTVTSSPQFAIFAQLFYQPLVEGSGYVKILPSCMFDILTPRALAYWIMDDGQYVKRGGVTLCTDNYSLEHVLQLKGILEGKFGLICSIHTKDYANRSRKYYRIYISGKSLPVLQTLVGQYMHPSMMYKLEK